MTLIQPILDRYPCRAVDFGIVRQTPRVRRDDSDRGRRDDAIYERNGMVYVVADRLVIVAPAGKGNNH